MGFDGILLDKLKDEFNILKSGRISKITESGDTDFILTIRAQRINYNLMCSFSADFARIHLTDKQYDNPNNPKSFTMFLRKHIEGYFIEDILTYKSDRIIYFKLAGYNELQDYTKKYLICEIMGRYSNLILTDEDFKIIEALKHDGVGEYNRTILPNALYEFPENNKLNPFDCSLDELTNIIEERKLKDPKGYMDTFNGVSTNIAVPVFKYENHPLKFYEYLHADVNPAVIINYRGKNDFYFNAFDYETISTYKTISEMLDDYYYKADIQAKIKLKTNDLSSFVSRQITKNQKKIEKLEEEKKEALLADDLKIKGELLLSCPNLKERKNEVTVFDYYNNKEITIKLDPKLTVIENSQKCYKKYQKAKTSLGFISEQENIALNEIEYFKLLKYQISEAGIKEALEIQDELINAKYLFKKDIKPTKKQKPKLLTYELENGSLISVGKNNIQNDYLTNHYAKPDELWFHVKNNPGSHVVLHVTANPTEDEIRTSALLAAYYSEAKESSSVQVDYTKVRNIKKIPGKKNCFVTYTHQKSIYIDPDEKIINELKVKK